MKLNVQENVQENVIEKSSDESKIIDAIKSNPYITLSDMAKLIGKTLKTVTRIIENSKRIERIDPDRGGHWKTKNK